MSLPKHKSWLFITTRPPWASAAPAACTDMLLGAAVFDQPVSLLFDGDGVYQLLPDQDGSALGQKSLARLFPALELYEVRNIYVSARALRERGLQTRDLLLPVQPLENKEIATLLRNNDLASVF